MEIVKKNIYYIPNICDDVMNYSYIRGNVKPMCIYLTDEGLKRIVPNIETYINGKPFQKSVVCDGTVYSSLREFCQQHNNMNPPTVWRWLNRVTKMPKEWQERGLKYYD